MLNSERAYSSANERRITVQELVAFCFVTITGLLDMFEPPPESEIVQAGSIYVVEDHRSWISDLIHEDETAMNEERWMEWKAARDGLREAAWKILESEEKV